MNARLPELVRVARELTRPQTLPSPGDPSVESPGEHPVARPDERPDAAAATEEAKVDPIQDFRSRFGFLPSLTLQPRGRSKPPLMSERKADSQIELHWLDGGPGVHYVIAIDAREIAPGEKRPPLAEWLWPAEHLPPTDIIYDCTEEVLHGKAKPILCDLTAMPVRVFAITPTQVEQLHLSAIQRVAPPGAVAFVAKCQDAGGRIVKGILPLEWSVSEAGKSTTLAALHATTNWAGHLEQSVIAFRLEPGTRLTLSVRSQLNGLTVELPIRVDPAAGAVRRDHVELTDENLATSWRPRPYKWQAAESPARPTKPDRN